MNFRTKLVKVAVNQSIRHKLPLPIIAGTQTQVVTTIVMTDFSWLRNAPEIPNRLYVGRFKSSLAYLYGRTRQPFRLSDGWLPYE